MGQQACPSPSGSFGVEVARQWCLARGGGVGPLGHSVKPLQPSRGAAGSAAGAAGGPGVEVRACVVLGGGLLASAQRVWRRGHGPKGAFSCLSRPSWVGREAPLLRRAAGSYGAPGVLRGSRREETCPLPSAGRAWRLQRRFQMRLRLGRPLETRLRSHVRLWILQEPP